MKKLLISTLILGSLMSANAFAELNKEQAKQLEEINQFLKENPSTISGLHTSLEQYVAGQEQAKKAQAESHDWLYNNDAHPITGNPDGKSVIINFTDYNCPYCKRLEKGLLKLASENSDIQVINVYLSFKQQQVAGLDTNAALYAMKVWKDNPEAFPEVNRLLMAKSGIHSKSSLEAVAKKTGTEAELKTTQEQSQVLTTNHQTFSALGLTGTPTMMMNGHVLPGYVPYDRLKEIVNDTF
ncbi:thioredoxin domain-containing protein [Vibrio sp. 10N.261.46.E12]|uniref:DsbA family protein n=1 Tax=unclassified Vibrio TaxID=2614977 RepID=UPI000977223E|nr:MULTISPECIES: DsbA family protein [unclassified Vibrio]OMO36689.1 protein-disulfide isomerase [Vibrio sp. 10N.261.45.E1]PMJ22646.1 protein-disulfide isomerase [Vibrio sp. 10N.286.45.B6]PML89510.1 protein-disulfide isomerase [Vibrio sp. 10N.261.49.E11]PMM64061.1 protein-disulfide isomerase [Vibrio sp. 10N.261.46.F12]PMM78635.1 protein-disulfide isomerase [Vibrio sp. 10N.261.46.E8]